MQIDDRLATVLRQRAGGEVTARIQYRQLLDLLGTSPSETQGPMLDAAYVRVGELSAAIPATARAAILREPGLRLRNPRLVVLLGEQDPPVAAAAIGAAQLGDEQWLDLVPALAVAARAHLRQRRDLGPRVGQLLARLGVHGPGLPPAQAAVSAAGAPGEAAGEPAMAASGPAPLHAPEQGIGAIVQRIEDFRKARRPLEGEVLSVDSVNMPPEDEEANRTQTEVKAFDFVTDALGRIVWSDPGVAPMVAGLGLAAAESSSPAIAALMRARQPVRAARLAIAGAPAVSGLWLLDAMPRFDPVTGGYTGYDGRMRSLDRPEQPVADARESEADRIRQLLHELRTPVNAIQGFAEVIQQQIFGPAPHEYRALAATIASDAALILAGFAELEQLARLESGAADRDDGICDFAAVLAATVAQLRPFTTSRDSGFAMEVAPGPLAVAMAEADAAQLAWRLLATLAGAAHPGETMRLWAGCESASVVLRLQLPTSLAAREDDELMKVTARHALNAGMFGPGFTLRLVRAEAKGAGGYLERRGQELQLGLPGLTAATVNHSQGSDINAIPG